MLNVLPRTFTVRDIRPDAPAWYLHKQKHIDRVSDPSVAVTQLVTAGFQISVRRPFWCNFRRRWAFSNPARHQNGWNRPASNFTHNIHYAVRVTAFRETIDGALDAHCLLSIRTRLVPLTSRTTVMKCFNTILSAASCPSSLFDFGNFADLNSQC